MDLRVIVTAAVLVVVGGLLTFAIATGRWRTGSRGPDSLQSLATTFVVLGIVFGDDRLLGYGFIGAGVILSLLSLWRRRGAG